MIMQKILRIDSRRIIQTDDCRHSARAFRYGFLHELAAHLNQTHRISEINHSVVSSAVAVSAINGSVGNRWRN